MAVEVVVFFVAFYIVFLTCQKHKVRNNDFTTVHSKVKLQKYIMFIKRKRKGKEID